MNYQIVNFEEHYPTVKEALKECDDAIELFKKSSHLIVFIHGYGSSGKGGKIGPSLRTHLETLKTQKKIIGYIAGERFELFNEYARNLNQKYPCLKEFYNQGNNGITIVEIK